MIARSPERRGTAWVLAALVRGYQGVSARRLPRCRYVPSCSEYAVEAIEGHGAWRGGWLGVRRVARCRPGGGFGFDPVPERTRGGGVERVRVLG